MPTFPETFLGSLWSKPSNVEVKRCFVFPVWMLDKSRGKSVTALGKEISYAKNGSTN